MKYAIVSKLPELSSQIDNRISKSKHWVIYNTIDNSYAILSVKNQELEEGFEHIESEISRKVYIAPSISGLDYLGSRL